MRATHCAKSWGIATFASKRDIREQLTATFSPTENPYQHTWKTNDSKWKTSIGPSSGELNELRGRDPPLNQCIGAVISSLRLDETTWKANFGSLPNPPSGSDRGAGPWDSIRRVMSRDSWSAIRVDDNSGRRLLDSFLGKPTDLRLGADGMLLSDEFPDLSIDVTAPDYDLLLQEA